VVSKQTTVVMGGITSLQGASGLTYSTYDKLAANYRNLPRSVNRYGGAQFSVTMWLFIKGSIKDENVAGRTLFMRGDKTKYAPMFTADGDTSKSPYFPATENNMDYAIVCPRIHFPTGKNCSNKLLIDVNTDRQLVQRFTVGSDDMNLDERKNALSLIPNKWVMLSFTFEDNYDLSNFERGIRVRCYINDALYAEKTSPGALRFNNGPAMILPGQGETATMPGAYMSDVKWHNWALQPNDVASLFAAGFDTSQNDADISTARTLQLEARNKVDLYNLDAHIARNVPVS
jgi:hypothetical protein